MNKEFDFLNIISSTLCDNSYLGNDCAYLDEYKLAISKDILIEDVHFSISYMTPTEIARKSLLVNISDILASGAVPKYALVAISGKLDSNFIEEFYKSLNKTAVEFNIKIIGGDLTKSDKLVVSVTLIGDYKARKISSRYDAKENYIVAVKGEFGSSAKGLLDLREGKDNYFTEIHKNPILYPQLSSEIAKNTTYPYAMMDSSDGLLDCLNQISEKSKVRIDVEFDKIPTKISDKNMILNGGEDYSLVICMDERDFIKFPRLKQIGICKAGKDVYIDNEIMKFEGYKHFE